MGRNSARSPLPLIPSPSGEGTGAVSLRAAASGSDGRCLSCLDRRIVSYGCAAAIDCAADDGCIAPTNGGALNISKGTIIKGATKKADPAGARSAVRAWEDSNPRPSEPESDALSY